MVLLSFFSGFLVLAFSAGFLFLCKTLIVILAFGEQLLYMLGWVDSAYYQPLTVVLAGRTPLIISL